MSKNKIIYNMLGMLLSFNGDYNFQDIITDEKVSECLTKLYFSMLCDNKKEQEEHYNSFEKMYIDLNDEQKEMAKVEIAKILKIDYKPKVKKKER